MINHNRKGGAFEKEQPERLARRVSRAGACESKNTESTEEIDRITELGLLGWLDKQGTGSHRQPLQGAAAQER